MRFLGFIPALDSFLAQKVSLYVKGTAAGDTTLQAIVPTADMAATDKLLEVAAEQYVYDTSSGFPVRVVSASSVGAANAGTRVPVSHPVLYNGSTYDPERNNHSATLLASAARTGTVSSVDQTNYNGRGVRISIDCTARTGASSVVFTVEVKDSVSGVYTAVLTSAAVASVSHVELVVYPGVTVAANLAASMCLSRTWRVTATHGNSDSITYSVSADVLL